MSVVNLCALVKGGQHLSLFVFNRYRSGVFAAISKQGCPFWGGGDVKIRKFRKNVKTGMVKEPPPPV